MKSTILKYLCHTKIAIAVTVLAIFLLIGYLFPSHAFSEKGEAKHFSPDKLITHLDHFTSETLKGRAAGSEGVKKAREYIKAHFKELGYQVENKTPEDAFNSSKEIGHKVAQESFKVPVSKMESQATLTVVDENQDAVGKYEQYSDFILRKDDFGQGGHFKGELEHVKAQRDLFGDGEKYKNQGALIDYQHLKNETGKTEYEIDRRLLYEETELIVYLEESIEEKHTHPPHLDIGFKTERQIEEGLIKIGVGEDLFKKLLKFTNNDYEVQVSAPLFFEEESLQNTFYVRPGEQDWQEKVILIGANLDGYGEDGKGRVHKSPLKYGASLALALELARVIEEENIDLDADLVFGFFDGAHLGHVGVKNYIEHPIFPPERTKVIHLEAMGTQQGIEIATVPSIEGNRQKTENLVKKIKNAAEAEGIEFETNGKEKTGAYTKFRDHGMVAASLFSAQTPANDWRDVQQEAAISRVDHTYLAQNGEVLLSSLEKKGDIGFFEAAFIATQNTYWLSFILIPLGLGKLKGLPTRKLFNQYPVIFVWVLLCMLYWILSYQASHSIYAFTSLIYEDITLSVGDLGTQILENLFPIISMGFWFWMYLVPVLAIFLLIQFYFRHIAFYFKFVVLIIGSYLSVVIPLNDIYDTYYSVLFPNLLDVQGGTYLIPLSLLLLALLLTMIFKLEMPERSDLTTGLVFLGLYYFLLIFTLAPYVYSQELIELRSVGGKIYFHFISLL